MQSSTTGATIRVRNTDNTAWENRKLLQRNDAGTGWVWIQSSATGTEVIVDDKTTGTSNLQWDFSAGWLTSTTEHYSSTANSTATLRFQGTSAVIYGKRDAHHGQMSISIDGGPAAIVDCYASVATPEAMLFDSGVLTDTIHTVVCTVTGTKQASSTGNTVALNYAKVMSTGDTVTPPPVTAGALPWAPPDTTWTVTHISNATIGTGSITFNAGTDNHVIYDEPITRRLQINGGRHLKVIGGEHNINVNNGGYYAKAESYSDNGGIEPRGQTGTVFLEGLLVHGPHAMDSIRSNSMGNADVVLQNCRLVCDIVVPVGDVSDGYYHTDGFQTWNGPRSLKMYNVTIRNPYQGGMIGDGALAGADWGPTYFERVNFGPGPTAGMAWKMVQWVNGPEGRLKGPFTFKGDTVYYLNGSSSTWDSVFKEPHVPYSGGALYSQTPTGTDSQGRQYASAPTNTPNALGYDDGNGGPLRFYRGLPPEGDYVPAGGNVGINYVSPGYQ